MGLIFGFHYVYINSNLSDLNGSLTYEQAEIPSAFTSTGTVTIEKIGAACILGFGRTKNALTANIKYTVCTLPEKFRPREAFSCLIQSGSVNPANVYLLISNTGEVSVTPFVNLPASSYFYTRAVYFSG